jgi:CrcB protein
MTRFLLVCLGGAIGTGCRYLIGLGAPRVFGVSYPYGTFIVNVVGCFLIAAFGFVADAKLLSPTLRLALMTGLVGGLTTYSSFNYETTMLFRQGAWLSGAVNVGLTLSACFCAGLAGAFVAGRFVVPRLG